MTAAASSDAQTQAAMLDEQWRILGIDPVRMRELDTPDDSASDEHDDVELEPADWRAWCVFKACRRAWRILTCGMGGVWYEGIDPTAVLATMQMLRIKEKHWPDVLCRLSILEDEARQFLNQSTESDSD